MSDSPSYLWLDYETTGTDLANDRPVEFGAVRTDLELNQIADPVRLRCALPPDHLPGIEATGVHGVGPITQCESGLGEYDFATLVYEQMTQPGTCNIGYNNYRFDDHISRYLFYRNLREPYEFHMGMRRGRWDLQEVARAARALAPEGIEWPDRKPNPQLDRGLNAELDSVPSYRLMDIAKANGIEGKAHDALNDAKVTLELARLIRAKQQGFFDWCANHRKPGDIEVSPLRVMVWVSGLLPKKHLGCSLVLPLTASRSGPKGWVVAHLDRIDDLLMRPDLEQMREWRTERNMPISAVRNNQSPMLFPLSTLTPSRAQRLGIDVEQWCRKAEELAGDAELIQQLIKHYNSVSQEFMNSAKNKEFVEPDIDTLMYDRGFPAQSDQQRLRQLHSKPLSEWLNTAPEFDDSGYFEQMLNVLGRNCPEVMQHAQWLEWHKRRCGFLVDGPGRTLRAFASEFEKCPKDMPEALRLQLQEWQQRVIDWVENPETGR